MNNPLAYSDKSFLIFCLVNHPTISDVNLGCAFVIVLLFCDVFLFTEMALRLQKELLWKDDYMFNTSDLTDSLSNVLGNTYM